MADEHVPGAAGLSARGAGRRRSRPPHHQLRREGDVAGEPRPPLRRVLLRRSGDRRDGPAADLVAVEGRDHRLQLAGVRRPQPDRPLRRRVELALSRGRVVRPCAQSHPGDAGGQRLAGDRFPRDAARDHRRPGLLRGRQPQQQLAVSGEGHQHRRRIRPAPVPLRLRLREPRLQPVHSVLGPDLHRPERTTDRHRRHHRSHSGSGLRPDLSRQQRQPDRRRVRRPSTTARSSSRTNGRSATR